MKDELRLEIFEDGWAMIEFNRPKQYNALNTGIVERLGVMLDEIEANKDIRALIFTGNGEKAFISGADIGQMGEAEYSPADAHYLITCGYKVFNRIEQLEIPTVAAINGYCLGGGLELALCCDIRIASENARFALPEIHLGIIPGWGGTYRLPSVIGRGRAMEMILQGKRIEAKTALEYGLVTDLFADVSALRAGAADLGASLAAKAPLTVAMVKKMVNRSLQVHSDLTDALSLAYCFTTEDSRNGIAAFMNKETATFTGR